MLHGRSCRLSSLPSYCAVPACASASYVSHLSWRSLQEPSSTLAVAYGAFLDSLCQSTFVYAVVLLSVSWLLLCLTSISTPYYTQF